MKLYNEASLVMGGDGTITGEMIHSTSQNAPQAVLDEFTAESEENITRTEKTPEKAPESVMDGTKDPSKEPEVGSMEYIRRYMEKYRGQTPPEEAGYTQASYTLHNNRLFSSKVNVIVNEVDPDDVIEKLFKKPVEDVIKKIIEKYHTYPGCTDFTTYEEVDKKSNRYKFLVACAKIAGCRVEPVIAYMVKKAA